ILCDILFSIFIRFPVKLLLRFQSISTSWKDIISEKEFKKAHRDQSRAVGLKKLLLRRKYSCNFVFRDLESLRLVMMSEEPLFPGKGFQYPEVVGSCDGLVLLKNPRAYKVYALLWNPSTREYRIIECPYVKHYKHQQTYPHACGLCYDSKLDDYKVILIYELFYAVYSLSNDSWTCKTSSAYPKLPPRISRCYYCCEYRCPRGITTQDGLFWSMNDSIYRYQSVYTTSIILYFDATSNKVKKLPTSNIDFLAEDEYFGLSTIKGCLSLYGGKYMNKELHVWIMQRQDGWKRLMTIYNLPDICKRFVLRTKFLYCTKNGEVVFVGIDDRLYIYYPERQQFVTILDAGVKFGDKFSIVTMCLDTLYFWRATVTRKRKQSMIDLTT
ncbi:hypothetical protein MTR67_036758, partial [Solanum verrucosum]